MEVFSKNKLLLKSVIVLIVLNLITIGAFIWKGFLSRPENSLARQNAGENGAPENRKDVLKILQKELLLTEDQLSKMQELRENFLKNEKDLKETIRSQRDSMNTLMFNKNFDDIKVTEIAKRISENEYKMELMRLEQAKGFRLICTEKQLEKFQDLVKEIKDYFKPGDPKNKRNYNK